MANAAHSRLRDIECFSRASGIVNQVGLALRARSICCLGSVTAQGQLSQRSQDWLGEPALPDYDRRLALPASKRPPPGKNRPESVFFISATYATDSTSTGCNAQSAAPEPRARHPQRPQHPPEQDRASGVQAHVGDVVRCGRKPPERVSEPQRGQREWAGFGKMRRPDLPQAERADDARVGREEGTRRPRRNRLATRVRRPAAPPGRAVAPIANRRR